MRHPRQNYLILIILLAVSAAALVGVYYFSQQIKDAPTVTTADSIFPRSLGTYTLITGDAGLSDLQCSSIKDREDTASLGLSGEICDQSIAAEYRAIDSGHVVFVHLIRISGDRELYLSLLDELSSDDALEGYRVIRLEGSEIGWFPSAGGFDVIVTQEGSFTPSGSAFEYADHATGNNDVIRYFLRQYAPVDAGS